MACVPLVLTGVAITSQHDRVVDSVLNNVLQGAVAVRVVAGPFVRRGREEFGTFVDARLVEIREDDLIADNTPGRTPI